MANNPLRNIPSVNELLDSPPLKRLVSTLSHSAVVSTVFKVLDEVRNEVQTAAAEMSMPNATDLAERIARRVLEGEIPPLRPVINATGVLFHAGLGRVPLAEDALADMLAMGRNYASYELDLATGRHASPSAAVQALFTELTGAEAALVVNNATAAMLLTLAALAHGREVVVARGHLMEFGGGSRLTEMISAAGASLSEVGAANKARLDDYAKAIGPNTAAFLLVHPGNHAAGEAPALEPLAALAKQHRLPLVHSIASGAMVDFGPYGVSGEPVVAESICNGADMAVFSGDRLLGGPQCGIVLGRKAWIDRLALHPLHRALRVDKITLAALAATLRLYRAPEKAKFAIPLLHLLNTSEENLKNRAERITPQMAAVGVIDTAEAVRGTIGLGGPSAGQALPTWSIALRPKAMGVERLATRLRGGTPAVVGRILHDRLHLDLRSVMPRQDMELVAAIEALGTHKEEPA